MKKLQQLFRNFFLNDGIIMGIILLNVVLFFIQELPFISPYFLLIDDIITVIFVVELIVKLRVFGVKNYFKSVVNTLDALLIFLSLLSILSQFFSVNLFLLLRIFRVFKFFRIIKFFSNVQNIWRGISVAFKDCASIFTGFIIILVIISGINYTFFKELTPEFFNTPLNSLYSVFRLFTIEGWYEIPNAITAQLVSPFWQHFVRLYFVLLLVGGGILSVSLINSVFVDAMVSDNNDPLKNEIKELQTKIDRLTEKIEQFQSNNNKS